MKKKIFNSQNFLNQLLPLSVFLICAIFLFASYSEATSLNLTPQTPDIFSSFIYTNFDGDIFTAQGFALELDDNGVGPAEPIVGGMFDLMAQFFNGTFMGGYININGQVPTLGLDTTGVLLTGNLTGVGFPTGGSDPIEFTFDVTHSDAENLFGGYGASGGIILSFSGLQGDFLIPFQNAGDGVADTFTLSSPVPEPATISMLLLGITGLAYTGIRKKS
ncbi:MAG: PEP-CTERM sorting domain-containing protein [Candidatus Schekmanbacteria bacterium]|nr:MAG: PEP-CTERM sorting domain-containing protein [Candidatus Schekmanbacteria bacterium]